MPSNLGTCCRRARRHQSWGNQQRLSRVDLVGVYRGSGRVVATHWHRVNLCAPRVVLAMALLWGWAVSRDDADHAPPEPQAAATLSSAVLLFIDGPAGRIEVVDAETGSKLAQYGSGEGSFLRGILRSLVRERRIRDLDAGGIFNLSLLDNRSLVISDPETNYWMAMEAFGVDNRQLFVELLERARQQQRPTAATEVSQP